jgi:rhodanese-related sulfurtransferase
VLDTRDADAYAAEHLAGSIHIGLSGRYASWVGTVLDPLKPIVIVAAPGKEKEEESAMRLGRIGFDRIAGTLRGGIAAARSRPEVLAGGGRLDAAGLAQRLAEAAPPLVVDVRTPAEWEAGHIEGALHLVLDDLPRNLARVPRDRSLVVVCKSGYRSSIGRSLLERAGFRQVTDLAGGMDGWEQSRAAARA